MAGGTNGEENALRSCYRRCLEVADELGAASVTFPAISAGAFGYPSQQAAVIALSTLLRTPTGVVLARLVAFDRQTFQLYRDGLDTWRAGS